MKHLVIKVIVAAAVVVAAFYAFRANRTSDNGIPSNETQAEVVAETPQRGQLVTSPLLVSGKARGTWFFSAFAQGSSGSASGGEANLSVTLKNSNGKILAQKGFQAKGKWMTEDFVEFEETLEFNEPETEYGVLLIEKDNPSGLSEFDASFAVPVRFK